MSDNRLEMPRQKKGNGLGKALAALVVLGLAGAGAWYAFSDKNTEQPVDSARQRLNATTGTPADGSANSGRDGSVLPVQDMSTSAGSPTNVPPNANIPTGAAGAPGTAPAPGTAGAASSSATAPDGATSPTPGVPATSLPTGVPSSGAPTPPTTAATPPKGGNIIQPRPGVTSPTLKTEPSPGTEPAPAVSRAEARLEQGMTRSSAVSSSLTPEQRSSLPATRGSIQDAAPLTPGRSDDSVVTSNFIRSLARWLTAAYQPAAQGSEGRTTASLTGANMRFGAGLDGLRYVGDDPVRGRTAVLKYVFTPSMMDALYRLYSERLIADMAGAAKEQRANNKPPLSPAQTADMFAVYARSFRQASASLRGVAALPDLNDRVLALHKAGDNVVYANNRFAEALFAFEKDRDNGGKNAEDLRKKLEDASRATEKAVRERAVARKDIADAIKRQAGGKTEGEDSLAYLAEWVNRRGDMAQSAPAVNAAADLLSRLADQCEAQAKAMGKPQ